MYKIFATNFMINFTASKFFRAKWFGINCEQRRLFVENQIQNQKFLSDADYYESASDIPNDVKVVIYGDELVSKALAYHLSNSLGGNIIVIRGIGPRNDFEKLMDSTLNCFYMNHLIVSNPRSSLLIRHSANLYNVTTCGAIYLAQTKERVKSFKRMISISKLFIPKECGDIELLSPEGM